MDTHKQKCEWCQTTARAASSLRYKKLGKHERRLLLLAAAPGDRPVAIVPPGASQDDQTSTRRAIRNLKTAGLVHVPPGSERVTSDTDEGQRLLRKLKRKYAVMRRFSRTALGQAVIEHYHRELKTGARIRWAPRLDDVTNAVVARCPHRFP